MPRKSLPKFISESVVAKAPARAAKKHVKSITKSSRDKHFFGIVITWANLMDVSGEIVHSLANLLTYGLLLSSRSYSRLLLSFRVSMHRPCQRRREVRMNVERVAYEYTPPIGACTKNRTFKNSSEFGCCPRAKTQPTTNQFPVCLGSLLCCGRIDHCRRQAWGSLIQIAACPFFGVCRRRRSMLSRAGNAARRH
jgi:hypothetical protein